MCIFIENCTLLYYIILMLVYYIIYIKFFGFSYFCYFKVENSYQIYLFFCIIILKCFFSNQFLVFKYKSPQVSMWNNKFFFYKFKFYAQFQVTYKDTINYFCWQSKYHFLDKISVYTYIYFYLYPYLCVCLWTWYIYLNTKKKTIFII